MRKRPSKRRIWTRFLAGKWCDEYDMIRHDLDMRAIGMNVEFNYNSVRLLRKTSGKYQNQTKAAHGARYETNKMDAGSVAYKM